MKSENTHTQKKKGRREREEDCSDFSGRASRNFRFPNVNRRIVLIFGQLVEDA